MIEENYRDYSIQLGRNARENDSLVESASPEDYWIHLSNFPSGHAIVSNPLNSRVPVKVLKHAAYMVKQHSKYSSMKKLECDVTKIKYITRTVRKGEVSLSKILRTIKV